MNKLIDWLQTSFSPTVNKIVQNPWILTIKNSVLQTLPLIFLGSIFSLLTIPQNYFKWWPNFWHRWPHCCIFDSLQSVNA